MAPSFAAGAVLLLASLATAASKLHPLSDEFISLINSQQNSWKAGRNFPEDTPMAYIKSLMGVIKDDRKPALPVIKHDADLIASLPEHFDPREKWPNCPSLHEIRDQGNCGSCWAHGAVEVMTDRVCIYSNGTKHFHFSVQDIVSCLKTKFTFGCNGGSPLSAFEGWRDIGFVSGGAYNASEGCMPYLIAPCEHFIDGKIIRCVYPYEKTPECVQKCRTGYMVDYKKDKNRAKKIYRIKGEDHIKAELFKNGPVEVDFSVYADFVHYKTGVYWHKSGEYLGDHAVKMMGWGKEGGKKYWLMANSWNSEWGDDGYFKIVTTEEGINEYVVSGDPELDGIYS